ncbi:EmrB/QacA family drug resistance transporter [Bacteroidia bacterium]|nr:EmrB/QacA family drug resistance transporter [Bacteroidia bacterium]
MQHNNTPFRFMSFQEFVPDSLRFWIYMLFLICFQFSNGMYFCAMSQMSGSLSLTPDDVRMMGNAVLVGLTMYFPLAFRLKFRFTNRTCLVIAASVLIAINLIVPHVQSFPVLVVLCFVAGFFRLFGTFECFSSVLPKIAPTHNYAVFLSFVFFVVLGLIHVFDIAASYIMYYYSWHYIHYFAIGLLLVVVLGAFVLMKPFRPMPKMLLYSVDWLGMVLWSIFILSAIFVTQYGEQMDWFHSPYIRAATGISLLALAANLLRIRHIRHPFIELNAFNTRNLLNLLVLFLFLDILLSSQQVLQNTFTDAVLHFDQLNTVNLYWFDLTGMLIGALFSWYALTQLKWHHKLVTFVGISFIVLYVIQMYWLITPYTNIEKLYLPLVCCGFGHVVVFIALTVYAQATAPFKNYFQVLCVLGLIRTGIGAPFGDAIYTRALEAEIITHSSLVVALRELFGWSIVLGTLVLIIIAVSRFKNIKVY